MALPLCWILTCQVLLKEQATRSRDVNSVFKAKSLLAKRKILDRYLPTTDVGVRDSQKAFAECKYLLPPQSTDPNLHL